MIYLTTDHVLTIFERETCNSRYAGLRDLGLLEAAIGRPQQSAGGVDAFPTIHDKAAALFEAFCQRQCFVDGNKRVAIHAVYAFYGFNGLLFENADDGRLFALAERLAWHAVEMSEIAEAFSGWVTPIPDPDCGTED